MTNDYSGHVPTTAEELFHDPTAPVSPEVVEEINREAGMGPGMVGPNPLVRHLGILARVFQNSPDGGSLILQFNPDGALGQKWIAQLSWGKAGDRGVPDRDHEVFVLSGGPVRAIEKALREGGLL